MGDTCRIRKVTTWLPLEKAQSVRMVTGPVQRHLALASVHVDAAGRDVRAEFRDRPGEATRLAEELAAVSRDARRGVRERGVRPGPPAPEVPARPPGAPGTPAQAGPL